MYNNVLGQAETYIAGEDLSSAQYTFVTDDGTDVTQTGAGLAATGVLFNAPVSGDAATVVRGGDPNVWVGTGGVTAGDEVASDANGKAVVAVADDVVLGIAREDAAADGLVQIQFLGLGQYVKA